MEAVGESMSGELDPLPPLPDITGMPIEAIVTSSDSVLARALRRAVKENHEQTDVLCAFGNSP